MDSNQKIGLLVGLIIVFAIAFIIDGLIDINFSRGASDPSRADGEHLQTRSGAEPGPQRHSRDQREETHPAARDTTQDNLRRTCHERTSSHVEARRCRATWPGRTSAVPELSFGWLDKPPPWYKTPLGQSHNVQMSRSSPSKDATRTLGKSRRAALR